MSKIGRKPIPFSSAKVVVDGKTVKVDGSKAKFVHELPEEIDAKVDGNELVLTVKNADSRDERMKWGLHRALLANKVKGAESGFEMGIKIVGLGYKAQLSGKKLVFSLGYSHKIEYPLPDGVTIDIDRTGQQLTVKSHDKALLGDVCDKIKSFRTPEPYKGTGIMRADEHIVRKAGKTGA